MSQFDPSIHRYAQAHKAGLSDREVRTQPDSHRPETAFQHVTRWFGTAWLRPEAAAEVFDSNRDEERPSGSNSKTVVSSMMPGLANAKRKPWVVSQLPA
jgi:hypothetical protein